MRRRSCGCQLRGDRCSLAPSGERVALPRLSCGPGSPDCGLRALSAMREDAMLLWPRVLSLATPVAVRYSSCRMHMGFFFFSVFLDFRSIYVPSMSIFFTLLSLLMTVSPKSCLGIPASGHFGISVSILGFFPCLCTLSDSGSYSERFDVLLRRPWVPSLTLFAGGRSHAPRTTHRALKPRTFALTAPEAGAQDQGVSTVGFGETSLPDPLCPPTAFPPPRSCGDRRAGALVGAQGALWSSLLPGQ